MQPLKDRVVKMVAKLEEAIEKVKEDNNQEVLDFLARRLYNMTGDVIMSLLIIEDASKAPELFAKSANVYVRYAEEEVVGHHHFCDELYSRRTSFLSSKRTKSRIIIILIQFKRETSFGVSLFFPLFLISFLSEKNLLFVSTPN